MAGCGCSSEVRLHDVIVARTPLKPETWTHVAVTRDSGGKIRIYLNGELDAQTEVVFSEP
jgi:hypothetical protein